MKALIEGVAWGLLTVDGSRGYIVLETSDGVQEHGFRMVGSRSLVQEVQTVTGPDGWLRGRQISNYVIPTELECLTVIDALSCYFKQEEYLAAESYWKNLSQAELLDFWKHYTVGDGRNMTTGLTPDTAFQNYMVISMLETLFAEYHDI